MFISTNTCKGKHIWIWTTRRCRKWKKGNKILVSLKKTHMIWHIRRFGKWKKGLFGFSTFRNSIWSISTFQRFEIQYETCPLFNFSTFWNWKWDPSTFWLFDFAKLTMKPFHFSFFRLFDFERTFRLKPCSVFFQPRGSPHILQAPSSRLWSWLSSGHDQASMLCLWSCNG